MKLDAHWMPFTANKAFKRNPRMIRSASGMYYTTDRGAQVLDMTSGLWCSNLGHGRKEITDAIATASQRLDYVPSFNFGHADAFELAQRLAALSPDGLDRVFFTNSGSEAVDTALKMALAYHTARGQSGRRTIISRERAYHGVNLGGTAAGGITNNTRAFGRWGSVDFLPHTLDVERNAFSRGLPLHGVEKAEALEALVQLHGPENIAAVIVEPIAGAGGMIPPPVGYLRRLREICDAHDILLIFDEVVCGFGRVGKFLAAIEFEVRPDMFTLAKGLTSGTVPMGAVVCRRDIHDAVLDAGGDGIEFWHGYTYSAHPLSCAAALACLDLYQAESLFTRAGEGIGDYLADALHGLRDLDGVIDIRNYGLLGAVELAPRDEQPLPGARVFARAWENGLMVRGLGNTIAVSPPLIVERAHIDEFADKLRRSIREALDDTGSAKLRQVR